MAVPSLKNWQAFNAGDRPVTKREYLFVTDAWLTGGEAMLGPYTFMNTLAFPSERQAFTTRPAVIVRADLCEILKSHGASKVKGFEHHHGGGLDDELAALASLFLGIRVQSVGEVRRFEPGGDPLGRPLYLIEDRNFVRHSAQSILPWHRLETNLGLLNDASHVCALSDDDASALLRAARLYQNAVWIAEADAATAWLLLVSAIECLATRSSVGQINCVEWLRHKKPQMVELLEKKCDASVLEEVANSLQDLMGSTAKFMNFVEKFLPEPPTTRPQAVFQINWAWTSKDGGALKQRVAKIYDLRSKALHQAIPFPSILCSAPFLNGTHAYVECPSGGVTDGSSSWKKSELPMHLHIFAYIVRGAILRWAAQAN